MRTPALLFTTLAAVGCTGLYVDRGNTFPCDFSQGPGVRDEACVPGDACGTDNQCHPYLYEGPRFEGPAIIPTFDAGGFARLHPVTIDGPVVNVATPPAGATVVGAMVQLADAQANATNVRGLITDEFIFPTQVSPQNRLEDGTFGFAQLAPGAPTTKVVLGRVNDTLVLAASDLPPGFENATFVPGAQAARLRAQFVVNDADAGVRELRMYAITTDTPRQVAEVRPRVQGLPMRKEVSLALEAPLPLPPGAGAVDVAVLTRSNNNRLPLNTVVVLTREPALQRGTLRLEHTGFGDDASLDADPTVMRFNNANTVLAVEARRGALSVLSTWQISVNNRQHELVQAWPDCDPCARDQLLRATPLPPELGLGVDVLCRSSEGVLRLRRVTGSTAAQNTDQCISTLLAPTFDPSRINTVDGDFVSSTNQVGLVLGGKSGELWIGDTLGNIQPLGLERVPRDVFPVLNSGVRTLAALTDSYLAVQQPGQGQRVGFRRIDSRVEFGTAESLKMVGVVHGTPGWTVLDTGQLARFQLDEGDAGLANLRLGAQLVTSAGDPIRRSAGGEAFALDDGTVVSLFVAADDGLYFVPSPALSSGAVTPQLTPEPSVPIRSLALERTPLGTDGVSRARGYLVTSRNVFEWTFGGSPARWTSRLLAVSAGEPLEVWFDTQRSALGRVGYTDGRVFTLPGGFHLTEELSNDAGVPVRVIDYENYAGWPMALTNTGLFIAGWDVGADGKLQNKFDGGTNKPMTWREVTMPDGSRPWLRATDGGVPAVAGRLFVDVVTRKDDGGVRQFDFSANLFLEDQVWQLSHLTRR